MLLEDSTTIDTPEPRPVPFLYRLTRAALGLSVAALGLLATLPLTILIVTAIKLEDRGSTLYRSVRLGKSGRTFTLLKFRTMSAGAEVLQGIDWTSTSVPSAESSKITIVGGFLRRFYLDELPQLINVLRGDLHLVGPRPERPKAAEERAKLIPGYSTRLAVTPGITGWAQVHYPYRDAREKLQYDLFYIQNRSFAFDVRILTRTVGAIFEASAR